jgi:hypothetical protein
LAKKFNCGRSTIQYWADGEYRRRYNGRKMKDWRNKRRVGMIKPRFFKDDRSGDLAVIHKGTIQYYSKSGQFDLMETTAKEGKEIRELEEGGYAEII